MSVAFLVSRHSTRLNDI
jgi:hypothetical protein